MGSVYFRQRGGREKKKKTLASIKLHRDTYSEPTLSDWAEKLFDLKEENARLEELTTELLDENEMLKDEIKRLSDTHPDFETI